MFGQFDAFLGGVDNALRAHFQSCLKLGNVRNVNPLVGTNLFTMGITSAGSCLSLWASSSS
jgi:hypothetical protein